MALSEADCPNFINHTPCPDGYLQRHAWARKMTKTHKQERCSGCGLFTIWVPRTGRAALGEKDE